MAWVIEHSPHKGSELLCLLMVANHANAEGREAYPSISKLAKKCRLSERQITRLLHRLEASGALRIERATGRGKHHSMTVVMDASPSIKEDNLSPFEAESPTSCHDMLSPFSGERVTSRAEKGDIAPEKPQEQPSYNRPIDSPSPTERVAPGADAPARPAHPRAAPKPTPKPTKLGAFIDAVRAAGVDYAATDADGKALKGSSLSPAQVAEVYVAIATGGFGDDWLRARLSVRTAIGAWNGYTASKRAPPAQRATGRHGAAKSASARVARLAERATDDADGEHGEWPGPAVGVPQVRRGLPGQLPR